MKKKYLIYFVIILFSVGAVAQTKEEVKRITENYNEKRISKTLNEIEDYQSEKSKRINQFLQKNKNYTKTLKIGKKIRVLDDVENGIPIYIETTSEKSSKGTRTNFIQPGGSLGLNLEGENMNIALWEVGGKTLSSHIEFQTEGMSRVIFGDSENEISFHSTHVSGTLISAGVNPDARGMASKATLKSYNHINDANEALTEAESNGLLISNHSYGVPVSGESGTTPSWRMGAYNNSARLWDAIANLAPYYLSVFSAGNDGTTTYTGGLKTGYDKLTGEKNSKNNLVVANAQSGIADPDSGELLFTEINSSSSQGPSDDGRIKPDITGLGTSIISTSNSGDTSYGTATGTSMSAPNVSGSLLLLQELYNMTYGNYMFSSTVKALTLNTANDAGSPGPDPIFGWGVLNVKKASETILEKDIALSVIEENTLANGESASFNVSASGTEPLKVMVVWNDPAGEAVDTGTLNDPTPVLVNDLDLRVNIGSETYEPWKLSLDDVSLAATKGDNIVDNVEQIIIENPNANDVYTVDISHKGTLLDNNSQAYSLVITGISATTLSNDTFEKSDISFWPNPVQDRLNITSSEINFSDNASVSIYDLTGREVVKKDNFENSKNLNIDLSALSKGLYILKLKDGQRSIQKRILKE